MAPVSESVRERAEGATNECWLERSEHENMVPAIKLETFIQWHYVLKIVCNLVKKWPSEGKCWEATKGAERGVARRSLGAESDSLGKNGARSGVPGPRRALYSFSGVYFLQGAKNLMLFGQEMSKLWRRVKEAAILDLDLRCRQQGKELSERSERENDSQL